MAKPRKKYSKYRTQDGMPVARCTQIIDLIGFNKRVLMLWARKIAMAGGDPLKKSKQACDIGTLTHKMIECHILGQEEPEGLLAQYDLDAITTATTGYEQYLKWEDEVKPEYLQSEIKLISEADKWGGTADILMKIGDELILGDFKTSKAVYLEHIIQIAAYHHCMHEIGEYQPTKCMLIHVPKELEDGQPMAVNIYEIPEEDLDVGYTLFTHALGLHRCQKIIDMKKYKHIKKDSGLTEEQLASGFKQVVKAYQTIKESINE